MNAVTELREAGRRLEAEGRALIEKADRLEAEQSGQIIDFDGPDTVALKVAAGMCDESYHTMRRWAVKYRLGWKRAGRWQVSRSKLQAFLMGRCGDGSE
jgi:hypothetical protein